MCLRSPLLCIAVLVTATLALAEDQHSTSQPNSDPQITMSASDAATGVNLPQLFEHPGDQWKSRFSRSPKLRDRTLAAGDGNTCYTMRSYRVERTERFGDEVTPRGYSTCQMASSFRVRSAAGQREELRLNER